MNSDLNIKRFVVLLTRAPFILFIESPDYKGISKITEPLGFVNNVDSIVPITIYESSDLRRVIEATIKYPDPIGYRIIDALADNMTDKYFHPTDLTSSVWQQDIKWQNVDDKPAPIHEYAITVDRITHELNTVYSENLESSTKAYDGVINLSSVNISVPFPKALLKECVADIYEIIKVMSMNREPSTIAKSKYMSVVQTGHETFNWCNLKKIEKDLIAVLKSNNIKIEE